MKKNLSNLIFLLFILLILLGILKNPQISLKGAYEGLLIWFNIIIPSLLPFFIISEILISIGFIDIISKFLEPLMRLIFNLPGIAAFPFSMSIVSGYPMGSKIVSSLRDNNLISKTEGERMIILSSTSGPLFMLGAITIGMLNNPTIAPLILYPHYLAAITMGFLFRFYKPKGNFKNNYKKKTSLKEMQNKTFHKQIPPIGFILSNSVKNSMNSIFLIGGFIIFYSVVVEILFVSKFLNIIHHIIPIDIELLEGLLAGILELTTGCKKISSSNMDLIKKISIINFLIGWGGISIHSQALAFISNTDINGKLYVVGKFCHGIFSTMYGLLLYKWKYKNIIETTFSPNINALNYIYIMKWPKIFLSSIKFALIINTYLSLLSMVVYLIWLLLATE